MKVGLPSRSPSAISFCSMFTVDSLVAGEDVVTIPGNASQNCSSPQCSCDFGLASVPDPRFLAEDDVVDAVDSVPFECLVCVDEVDVLLHVAFPALGLEFSCENADLDLSREGPEH